MADLVFTNEDSQTVTFSPTSTGFNDVAGRYWLSCPEPNMPIYSRQDIEAPANDGSFTKFHGFRRREFNLTVCYVGDSAAAARTSWQDDIAKLAGKVFSIAMPDGETYPSCEIESGNPDGSPRVQVTTKAYFIVAIKCFQKRLS